MIGLLVALLLSFLILNYFDKSLIDRLGLIPNQTRVNQFTFGFLVSVFCALVYFGCIVYLSESKITINSHFCFLNLLKSLMWVLRSVLFEELLFRGALLFIGIKIFGSRPACLVSAIVFGVYHWFSYNIFGDVGQMLTVFVLTGVGGLLFAYSFLKTQSMYLQTGLHLGWNVVTIIVFSQGPLGQQYLISSESHPIGMFNTIVLFIFQLLALPIATYYYLNGSLRSKGLIGFD